MRTKTGYTDNQIKIMDIFSNSDDITMSLADIARRVGCSREYVRQTVATICSSEQYQKFKQLQSKERKKQYIGKLLECGLIPFKMHGDNIVSVDGEKFNRIVVRGVTTDKFYNKERNQYARILKSNSVKVFDVKKFTIFDNIDGVRVNVTSQELLNASINIHNCYEIQSAYKIYYSQYVNS